MSAIAYITNQEMIEFHRLNGNKTINFWRLGNTKKISFFKKGDLLFFLSKGTEKGKEKGIVGYGVFQKSMDLNIHQMWTQYKEQNGYATKEKLMEEIIRISKNNKIPKVLNCLYLKNVVFFQTPVYLSEIGVYISNKMESYMYLDKENITNTYRILKVAENVGSDIWSMQDEEKTKAQMEIDANYVVLKNISEKLQCSIYTDYEKKKINKYIKNIKFTKKNIYSLSPYECIEIKENKWILKIPCFVNTLDFQKKIQYLIGHCIMFKNQLEKTNIEINFSIEFVFNQMIKEELSEILQNSSILFECDDQLI